jgi:cytochrome d ubiquinol oxidase subunit I
MLGSVVTASIVMSALGSYYLLTMQWQEYGRTFVRVGVIAGVAAAAMMVYPTGDSQGRNVALDQPVTLAAMEGLFHNQAGAPLAILGQPDMETLSLDNPLIVPRMLSILTYRRWKAEVHGLADFPRDQWPDEVPLLYYAYHIMVGLGTIFAGMLALAAFLLWRGRLFDTPMMLWGLMLLAPFPYIANTAGWMTAELGRQPWVVYGLMRTAQAGSPQVAGGNVLFTLIGFAGMYAALGLLFLFLVYLEVQRGPGAIEGEAPEAADGAR